MLGLDAWLFSRRSLQFAARVLVARMSPLSNKILPRSWPIMLCQGGCLLNAAAFSASLGFPLGRTASARRSPPSCSGVWGRVGALGAEVHVACRAAALLFLGESRG